MSAESSKKLIKHDVEMYQKYKNLLIELTRKNVRLKYRNSWLGIFWSFLQPLLNMIVLSVVFGALFGRKTAEYSCYPIYLFSGRLLYEFFATATKQAMLSFRKNAAIIKKVYVPKYMYPLSSIFSTFVNFAISLLCFVTVWIFFKITGISGGDEITLTWHAILFVVPMFLALVFSTGVGLILSVITVFFKDIEYIWDVVTRLLLYMVPILYPLSRITSPWIRVIIKINPLYSFIQMFRQAILYGELFSWRMLLYAFVVSTVTLIIGILIFNWKSDELVYHL